MGFFSALCQGCDKSILAPYHLTDVNAWMNRAAIIKKDGTLIIGQYNGYGVIHTDDDEVFGDVKPTPDGTSFEQDPVFGEFIEPNYSEMESTVWHEACWKAAGSPQAYLGPSCYAPDQGFFINENEYNVPEPKGAVA